jgi:polysaccharide biosynthesis protein PslG
MCCASSVDAGVRCSASSTKRHESHTAHGPGMESVPRSVRKLAVAALAAAILIMPAAQARAATPAGFFGLNFAFKDITGGDVLFLKKSGATTVRWTMNWSNVQPKPRTWNWSRADAVVGDLAAQGIRILPVMWGTPRWVASSAITPPIGTQAQRDAWRAYLRAAIRRYGPGGNYWSGAYRRQHPGRAALPINTWQIWNEANLKSAMNPPKPSTYARLLTLSHAVIHQADAKARVMFAGLLSHPPNGLTAWDFLRSVYHQPGTRNAFDLMASNAYSGSVSGMLADLGHIRNTMAANGQGPKPLWISEVGWGSAPPDSTNGGQTKGWLGQRKILIKAFNALLQKRSVWRIGKVLWFNFRDPAGYKNTFCAYCTSAGLLTNKFKTKPSWSAFLGFTGG